MRKFTIYLLVFFAFHLSAQGPDWKWASATGGDKQNVMSAITVDNSGNSYAVGYFYSTSLPFGEITLTNTSPNNSDVFLFKCDKNGDLKWVKKAVGMASETSYSVAVDNDGYTYWTGSFSSPQISFDSITLNNAGSFTSDIFVVKYNRDGKIMWAKSYGGFGNEYAATIKFDKQNSVYLSGNFASNSVNFDNISLASVGSEDLFVAKLNLNGNVLWAKSVGGNGQEFASDMAVDKLGNCYLAGRFSSQTLNFAQNVLTCDSASRFLIAKFSNTGVPLWAKTEQNENAQYIAVDGLGNVYVTGSINGLGSKFGETTFVNADKWTYDQYLVKYNQNGDLLWVKNAGGDKNDIVKSISIDNTNNVYLAGTFQSSALNLGDFTLNSNGDYDMYFVRYTPDGTINGALKYGGTKTDEVGAFTVDLNGDLFLVGMYNSPVLSFGNKSVNAITENNIFIASTVKPDSIAGCMDKNAKNYNPLATTPAQCIYDSIGGNQQGLTYKVTVPQGTFVCYFAGEVNGWMQQQMQKVDSIHYEITFPNATVSQQYKYCSGPGWGFVENTPNGNNRTWTQNDVVSSWSQLYNPNTLPEKVTYNVTVPSGTKECWIAGAHNNWMFSQMQRLDSLHYTITVNTTTRDKYKYVSGPDWKYSELDANLQSVPDRNYTPNDVVARWAEIYNPNTTNPIVGCMDKNAKNYNPLATKPAQCIYDSISTPVYGCMDSRAKNYNPLATMPAQCVYDSTSTNPVYGCMDPKASNFNPLATLPSPCMYDTTGGYPVKLTYRVTVPSGTFECYFAGDINGWTFQKMNRNSTGQFELEVPNALPTHQYKYCSGPGWVFSENLPGGGNRTWTQNDVVTAWMQVYNPNGTTNPVYGCMDTKAKNYNPLATAPAQCLYDSIIQPIYGCMDSKALNYNPLATAAGQCLYDTTQIIGCMDPKAQNYNPKATVPGPCNFDTTIVTPTSLTYRVTVPAGTVECYFAGQINNWTQQKMTKTGELQYEITFQNATKWQEYKYCSGPSWAFGENTPDGKNRVWSENDVVTSWANLYNPNATATDVTYTVTVPLGTNACYFAGAANNWQFSQMIKVTATTYKITLHTAYRDKYKYLSGPDWKYCELDSNYQSTTDRNFTTADMVMRWGLVYNPNGVDEIIGCTNPKATNFNKLATKDDGSCQFPQTTTPVYGCTNPVARNYNPLATIENGSCMYGDSTMIVWGCTNSTASNYNPKAVKDNGTCVFGTTNYVFGCMNPTAKNYNPQATKEDGSCIFVDSALVVWGCTNPTAKNYNPKANRENGTCTFVDSVQVVWGCTNVLAKNYNPKATMENGSCIFAADPTVIFGCTKQGALNYNPLANKENGSCVFKDTIIAVLGCTSPMAKNYNPTATKDNGTCIFQDSTKMILGCTNPTAKNYNRLATHDNGTCVFSDEATKIYGCTKSTAKNYNPLATVENGSCIFNDTIKLPVYGCTNKLALNYNPLATVNNGTCKFEEQLVKGCMDKKAKNYNPLARVNDGSCIYDSIRVVYGCTDSLALNYNPLAKIDNNNCIYQTLIPGCMDVLALNYNPYANVKDGSCKYPVKIWGCTDKSAVNYNSLATHNDGNCQYVTQILGCTDPLATNYNPLATKDNRTCVFPPVVSLGCTNKQALNYNPNANTDNGTCVFETITDTISGCMDKVALNYNPVATKSNGSCVYAGVSIAGCTSQMALNYNPKATEDDESCIFAKPVNIVLPVDNDILVAVKDTLAEVLENSCSFDFNTPIDTVYIVSSTIIGINEIQVVWAIKQGTNITNVTSNYVVDKDGKALLFLSMVCNGGSSKVIAAGRYGAPYGGSSVQGVTVSSYYQVPSNITRLNQMFIAAKDVVLYPNPVKDNLQIEYKSTSSELVTLQVTGIDGKCVMLKQFAAVAGNNHFVVNTSSVIEGIYTITLRTGSNVMHVNKLIKY